MSMVNKKNRVSSFFLPLFSTSIYLFLYIPIIILVVFSFNKSAVPFMWEGLSLYWYKELFKSSEIWHALKNSLIVASSAVFLSISLALLFVLYSRASKLSNWYLSFFANSAIPEIVLAVGLLSVFSFFSIPLGVTTLIAGHTLIGLGFVVPIVRGRFIELDRKFTDASLDLGATHEQTIWRVIVPLLWPAIIGSALIVFALSLDDFIISFFCSGGTTQTLPIYIFIMIRSGATPLVNALSTLLLLVSSAIVVVFASLKIKRMDFLR